MTDSIEHLVQMYGFLGAFFVLTTLAAIYALRRLLNKDDGLLTLLATKHILFIDKTIETMNHITTTQDKIQSKLDSLACLKDKSS